MYLLAGAYQLISIWGQVLQASIPMDRLIASPSLGIWTAMTAGVLLLGLRLGRRATPAG
jgi:hypothetical protein